MDVEHRLGRLNSAIFDQLLRKADGRRAGVRLLLLLVTRCFLVGRWVAVCLFD